LQSTWKKITNWELWPFIIIYAPLGFLWLYYAIRARAFWYFSNVNPTLEFAGFEGESKKEMYAQLPEKYYPQPAYITGKEDFEIVKYKVESLGIRYPFIAKPDIGMHGILVRKVHNIDELLTYHKNVPVDYLVQEFVDLPMEFSVFHIRYPHQQKGIVTGFILKEYLQVYGDGKSSLLELIRQHPKAKYREEEMKHLHKGKMEMVIPKDEKYALSFTGNHNRGAKFINLHNEIDERLTSVFDKISLDANHFYYGRYDFKCTSIEDLKQGKNISILEYNGAGAEPNHIYDCGMSYFDALRVIAMHWRHMYKIGRVNYKKGIPYWTYKAGKEQLDKAGKFFENLRKYDLQF
jgi:hypothetical protein